MNKKKSSTVILFYKPFSALSQFTSKDSRSCLKDFGPFPPDVYPVGRLDYDSEGLLLLTNDARLNHALADPRFNHPKTYLAQIEGTPDQDALERLRSGVMIQGRKTKRADVSLLEAEPPLPPRPVPIRFRKSIPTSWISLTLTEGRNRQVRRMTAAVGHPTLRLIRVRIGVIEIGSLRPGEHRALSAEEIRLLKLAVGTADEQ